MENAMPRIGKNRLIEAEEFLLDLSTQSDQGFQTRDLDWILINKYLTRLNAAILNDDEYDFEESMVVLKARFKRPLDSSRGAIGPVSDCDLELPPEPIRELLNHMVDRINFDLGDAERAPRVDAMRNSTNSTQTSSEKSSNDS